MERRLQPLRDRESNPSPAIFVRIGGVVRLTGLGRSTIYRLMAEEQFPPPVRLAKRVVAWRRKDNRARLVQSTVFRDTAGFSRWCDADSVRFDYPIVFSIMRREGGALLEAHEQSSITVRDHEEP